MIVLAVSILFYRLDRHFDFSSLNEQRHPAGRNIGDRVEVLSQGESVCLINRSSNRKPIAFHLLYWHRYRRHLFTSPLFFLSPFLLSFPRGRAESNLFVYDVVDRIKPDPVSDESLRPLVSGPFASIS